MAKIPPQLRNAYSEFHPLNGSSSFRPINSDKDTTKFVDLFNCTKLINAEFALKYPFQPAHQTQENILENAFFVQICSAVYTVLGKQITENRGFMDIYFELLKDTKTDIGKFHSLNKAKMQDIGFSEEIEALAKLMIDKIMYHSIKFLSDVRKDSSLHKYHYYLDRDGYGCIYEGLNTLSLDFSALYKESLELPASYKSEVIQASLLNSSVLIGAASIYTGAYRLSYPTSET